jgi:hypothetical protein
MTASMVQGFGQIVATSLQTNRAFFGGFAEIKIDGKNKIDTAFRYNVNGRLVKSDTRTSEEIYTCTVTQQTIDQGAIEMAYGEQRDVATAATYYKVIDAIVPTSAPYTISTPGLTVGNQPKMIATLQDNGAYNLVSGVYVPLDLTTIVTGSPTQFQVLATGGTSATATFASSLAGAPVNIAYPVPVASGNVTIGLATTGTLLNLFALSMIVVSDAFPNGLAVVAPFARKTSLFGLDSKGVSSLTNVFEFGTIAGQRNPFYTVQL